MRVQTIALLLQSGIPVLLLGRPGKGKTALAGFLAKRLLEHPDLYIYQPATALDPTLVAGIHVAGEEVDRRSDEIVIKGKTLMAHSFYRALKRQREIYQKTGRYPRVLLCLDEFTNLSPALQVTLAQQLADVQAEWYGERIKNLMLLLLGNKPDHSAAAHDLIHALRARLAIADFEISDDLKRFHLMYDAFAEDFKHMLMSRGKAGEDFLRSLSPSQLENLTLEMFYRFVNKTLKEVSRITDMDQISALISSINVGKHERWVLDNQAINDTAILNYYFEVVRDVVAQLMRSGRYFEVAEKAKLKDGEESFTALENQRTLMNAMNAIAVSAWYYRDFKHSEVAEVANATLGPALGTLIYNSLSEIRMPAIGDFEEWLKGNANYPVAVDALIDHAHLMSALGITISVYNRIAHEALSEIYELPSVHIDIDEKNYIFNAAYDKVLISTFGTGLNARLFDAVFDFLMISERLFHAVALYDKLEHSARNTLINGRITPVLSTMIGETLKLFDTAAHVLQTQNKDIAEVEWSDILVALDENIDVPNPETAQNISVAEYGFGLRSRDTLTRNNTIDPMARYFLYPSLSPFIFDLAIWLVDRLDTFEILHRARPETAKLLNRMKTLIEKGSALRPTKVYQELVVDPFVEMARTQDIKERTEIFLNRVRLVIRPRVTDLRFSRIYEPTTVNAPAHRVVDLSHLPPLPQSVNSLVISGNAMTELMQKAFIEQYKQSKGSSQTQSLTPGS